MKKEHIICASDGKTQARIDPELGACLSSLRLPFASGVRETLFCYPREKNAPVTDLLGGLPFLFPVCGRLSRNGVIGAYLYAGKVYHMKIHGFSWYQAWTVETATDNNVTVCLQENPNTLVVYPFQFTVRLQYEIQPGKLICRLEVINTSKTQAMPYAAGFHPYFLISGDKANTRLAFESLRRFQYNDALTDIVDVIPKLATPLTLSDPEINEQLSVLSSDREAILSFENGEKLCVTVTQHAESFPYLQLYHIPDKPFFCIEHWMAVPNALNTVSGMRWLSPGASERACYEIAAITDHQ